MTITTIQKWGNSQGIRIPKGALVAAGLQESDNVEIIADKETITLRKLSRPKSLLPLSQHEKQRDEHARKFAGDQRISASPPPPDSSGRRTAPAARG